MNETNRMDRTAFTVETSHEAAAEVDRRFWWSRTPHERIRAIEVLRQRNYGPSTSGRLQRVLEIARRPLR